MNTKTCTRCGEEKPATTEYFHKHSRCTYGLRPDCKVCVSEIKRNSVVAREYRKRRYAEKGDELRAKWREWAEQNREYLRERGRQDAALHRDERRAYWKTHYELHGEAIRARKRQYYAENRDHVLALRKARYDADPQRHIERSIRYQAKTRGAPDAEKIDREYIYQRDGGRCHICGKRVPHERFELDHLVPVSKGGAHTHVNLRLAHRSCNASRNDGRIPAQLLLVP